MSNGIADGQPGADTHMVKDINPGTISGINISRLSYGIQRQVVFRGI